MTIKMGYILSKKEKAYRQELEDKLETLGIKEFGTDYWDIVNNLCNHIQRCKE